MNPNQSKKTLFEEVMTKYQEEIAKSMRMIEKSYNGSGSNDIETLLKAVGTKQTKSNPHKVTAC